jgi:AcrR family transcriptional regulator
MVLLMDDTSLSKGERTRQSILEAAYDLFLTQGYAATSMRQIASQAGLALGGIYNHFSSKEAIFSELIFERHPYRQVVQILAETPTDDLEIFVRQAANAMVTELGKRPDFIKLMLIEMVEFKGQNMPGIIERVLPDVIPLIQHIAERRGGLRNMSPFIFFRAFIGLFFSYYLTEMMIANHPVFKTQDKALDQYVEIFLHGIMADKERA